MTATLTFAVPPELEASAPPARRDAVRLLVARPGMIVHAQFAEFADNLSAGDLVVVNVSATLPAAVLGSRADGRPVSMHFATALDDGDWVVEVRPARRASGPVDDLRSGERLQLPDGVMAEVVGPQPAHQHRLWRTHVRVEGGVLPYLARVGHPIRYGYVPRQYPLSAYQTVFAREPGSAEMPSAARPFTAELVTELVSRGIGVAPIVLHTGVSSQEAGEPPQPERFQVPEPTARQINLARESGARVVAVGTTATRAVESAADSSGMVRARHGWTDLVLGPDRPARVVNGLLTGWHAPGASHLDLLEAVAGPRLVADAYAAALRARYRWHEFGDSCLLLP